MKSQIKCKADKNSNEGEIGAKTGNTWCWSDSNDVSINLSQFGIGTYLNQSEEAKRANWIRVRMKDCLDDYFGDSDALMVTSSLRVMGWWRWYVVLHPCGIGDRKVGSVVSSIIVQPW